MGIALSVGSQRICTYPSGAKGTNPRPLINGHMFRVITFQLLQLHEVGYIVIVMTGTMVKWDHLYGQDKGTRCSIEANGRVLRPTRRAEPYTIFIWHITDQVLLCLPVPSGTSIGWRAYSQCATLSLSIRLTDIVVLIHNYVQSIHMKNLMDERSETLARPKQLSG